MKSGMNSILGIRHITAIAGDPRQNVAFTLACWDLRQIKGGSCFHQWLISAGETLTILFAPWDNRQWL